MGKASTGKLLQEGNGCFYEEQDLLREDLPKGRRLSRGGVSPREGVFQGRVSTEEGCPRTRVSLANAGGSRRGLCHKTARANVAQPASWRPPEVSGGCKGELGSPTTFLPGLGLLEPPRGAGRHPSAAYIHSGHSPAPTAL